jgi:hypothetical protein
MEELMGRYTRDDVMRIRPLHRNKFAYQIGRSTETALHIVVTRNADAVGYKEVTVRALLDMEGSFDRTSFDAVTEVAERHGVESTTVRWI